MLASIRAPAWFALRRLRARLYAVVALTLALAGAGALIGWSSLTAALAQERSVRLQLGSLPPSYRSVHVRYYTLPLESDYRAARVEGALNGLRDVAGAIRRVQVWHSIDPQDPRGTELVVARNAGRDVALERGRLPRGCLGLVCEAVALTGRGRVGERVPLGKRRVALIVGRATLRPEALPDRSELAKQTLLVRAVEQPLAPLLKEDGSTVLYSVALDPERVRGFALGALGQRLRRDIIRLERGDSLVRATAPLPTIDSLAERGRVARRRLLLIAGQAAALVIAFAAFVAGTRRRESEIGDAQLRTLGASRGQVWTARAVEAAVPTVAAVVCSLVGLGAAAALVAPTRGLPAAFVRATLPFETMLAIVASGALAFVLLVASVAPARRSRFGLGAIELAALTALAVLVWQTVATGALDPARVAGGGEPVILLLPALAFLAAGVLLARLLPFALRAAERLARRGPPGARLGFLAAARNPGQTAAATTFLAVALGGALFSLDYRATLEQQARDQARFTAGAQWRVLETGRPRQPNVTPLTRFATATVEHPTPVVRLDGDVTLADASGATRRVTVLALPAARLGQLTGWRRGFSSQSPAGLAARLRPTPVRLSGPAIAAQTDALRVWARAKTDYARAIDLHLLLPGQNFAHLRLGFASRRWHLLELPFPPALRGAQLVGVEFAPTRVPIDFKYDPQGFVDLGRIEQRRHGVWSPLPSIAGWTQTISPDGTAGILVATPFLHAPIARGIRFDLNGTFRPLIRPKVGLPVPDAGFQIGRVPVIASDAVAADAVDGLLTLDVPGQRLEAHVVATAGLFPTITHRRASFVVVDYDTLFAALNADQPGLLAPTEAWFFHTQPPGFAARLERPPFRVDRLVDARGLEARLLSDPLASGTRSTLLVAAVVAAVLALLGLVLASRSSLAVERLQLAEYEALGVSPSALRRSAQVRLLALAALGVVAGVVGGFAGARLTASFVAVTGTATQPLPPIENVIAWTATAVVVVAVSIAGAFATTLVAGRALREPVARRLRG